MGEQQNKGHFGAPLHWPAALQHWAGRTRFVALIHGLGRGERLLALWQAWAADPARSQRLTIIVVEPTPPSAAQLTTEFTGSAHEQRAQTLARHWPVLTPDLHPLNLEGGRIELLLAVGTWARWQRELVASCDALCIDAPLFAPSQQDARRFKPLARLCAPLARLWAPLSPAQDAVAQRRAGFAPMAPSGLWQHQPRAAPARLACEVTLPSSALVIGAGLAGSACAWALAQQGVPCVVLDQHALPAQEASGNPAGLFHGVVHAADGPHARFNRVAALQAQRVIAQALAGGVAGALCGVLRLESTGLSLAAMSASAAALGLPPQYVQALGAAAATALCGLPLPHPAWFYPGGGWVRPAELVRWFLQAASASFIGCQQVTALHQVGTQWQALGADGRCLAQAPCVVLASAGDSLRLLGAMAPPLRAVRGQLSVLHTPPGQTPQVPMVGAGFAVRTAPGELVFGATQDVDDFEPGLRAPDHATNLLRLKALTGLAFAPNQAPLQGRVGWRWLAPDRLPLVGAVAAGTASLVAQPSMGSMPRSLHGVARQPGLYLLAGLGSRGLGWAPLAAQILAAQIVGAPCPAEASLRDAIDPARFALRAARRHAQG